MQEYDAGLDTPERSRLTLQAPIWEGQKVVNTESIFVSAEQGLGDEIMFLSCLPDLEKQASNIIYEVDSRLLPIVERSFPAVKFVKRHSASNKDIQPGFQIAAGSLPHLFRNKLDDFPESGQFLFADKDKVEKWRDRYGSLGPGLNIGITWRGGTRVDPKKRSISLEQLRHFLETPGCNFIDIQYGDTQVERTSFENDHHIKIHRFDECQPMKEQDDFASQLYALDLIIGVSNATLHLAGALGIKAWSLLPFVPSWRWGYEGSSTAWYPSLKLYRQAKAGDWKSVIDDIGKDLRSLSDSL
jgi:hypothetical protein